MCVIYNLKQLSHNYGKKCFHIPKLIKISTRFLFLRARKLTTNLSCTDKMLHFQNNQLTFSLAKHNTKIKARVFYKLLLISTLYLICKLSFIKTHSCNTHTWFIHHFVSSCILHKKMLLIRPRESERNKLHCRNKQAVMRKNCKVQNKFVTQK